MTEQPQSPQPPDDGEPTSATPAMPEPSALPEPPTVSQPATPPQAGTLAPLPPGPEPAPTPADRAAALVAERPEVAVGGAFAGGFLFAMILRRLAR